MIHTALGGLDTRTFLRRHWQKAPLLARDALPEVAGMLGPEDLRDLACREDVESRLVLRRGRHWELRHGPFRRRDLARLPQRDWSLLVQGVDQHVRPARDLMRRFAFVPYARHDDLMVSLAPPGGGVGPHFDSYDVFLIQGLGRRRWAISTQRDLALVEDAPLRILRRFAPRMSHEVAAGDVLYLPPRCAHDGVASTECMTWSVGFRAPSRQELAVGMLGWLQETLQLGGMYRDPDLRPQRHPAQVGATMVDRVHEMLRGVRWTRRDVARFLGCHLTEPKPNVWFERPARASAPGVFARRVAARGIELAPGSRMLVHGSTVFLNGEASDVDRNHRRIYLLLADAGRLEPSHQALPVPVATTLRDWHAAGYLVIP